MKITFLLFLSLLLPTLILAQDKTTHHFQQKISIYFASGQAALDANAIEVLSSFIDENEIKYTDKLYLQAFTDDRGSNTKNEQIAQKRATSVQEYLEDKLDISTYTKPSEQLVLDKDKDAVTQRKEFRRVEVEYWIEKEEGLVSEDILEKEGFAKGDDSQIDAFFTNTRKEAIQIFEIDPTKTELVKGKQGTMIQIPANSFVDKEGKTVTTAVEFTLQEAMTDKSMIFQNLTTTSGDDFLETGGMFRLAARTMDGVKVELKSDATIFATLPTKEATFAEMQTYVGTEDESGSIDWIASKILVENANNQSNWSRGEVQNRGARYYFKTNITAKIDSLFEPPSFTYKLPKVVDKPKFRTRYPRMYKLYKNPEPSKTALEEKYKQHTEEKKRQYNQRISKKYKKKKDLYQKRKKQNEAKVKRFEKDSSFYVETKEKYQKDSTAFAIYQGKIQNIFLELRENTTKFNLLKHQSCYNDLANSFFAIKNKSKAINLITKTAKRDCRIILKSEDYEEKDKAIFENILTEAKKISKENSKLNFSGELHHLFKKYKGYRYKNEIYLKNGGSTKDYSSIKRSIAYFSNRVEDPQNLSRYQLKRTRAFHKILHDNFKFEKIEKDHEKVKKTLAKKEAILESFQKAEERIVDFQKKQFAAINQLDLVGKEKEQAREVPKLVIRPTNLMRVRLGWTNCDRSIRVSPIRMNCELIVGNTDNTKIYMIFGNTRTIMSAKKEDGKSFVFQRIPKEQNVEIIGVRTREGKVEIFKMEGQARTFKRYRPVFKEVSPSEVEDMIAQQ